MNEILNDNPIRKTYTVSEVAEILGLSKRGAYDFCNKTRKTGEFKVLNLGKSIRIHKDSFDEWFDCI